MYNVHVSVKICNTSLIPGCFLACVIRQFLRITFSMLNLTQNLRLMKDSICRWAYFQKRQCQVVIAIAYFNLKFHQGLKLQKFQGHYLILLDFQSFKIISFKMTHSLLNIIHHLLYLD